MKRRMLTLLLMLFGASLALAQTQNHRYGVNMINNQAAGNDCSAHLHISGTQFQSIVRDEQSQTLPNQPLTIRSERNGGIEMTTWDKPEFSIKLCKQVASDSDDEGRRILDETKLTVEGSTVSVSSPGRGHGNYNLGTTLIVQAPKDATVDLSVRNGGIAIHSFSGTAAAHAQNGGISLHQSTGKLTLKAQNGGVNIQKCSGDITAVVENGGLIVGLPDRWEGKGLDANTRNGGLTISLPANFNSGLEVTGSEHVAIECRGAACDNGQRTWENGQRMFRLGSSPAQVRATSANGRILIQEAGNKGDL